MEMPNTPSTDIEAEELPDVPVPQDIKTVFQGGLFLLAVLAASYVAAEIIFPIVLAFILMLVLQPAMRFLESLHLPRSIAAVAIIMVLFGGFVGFGAALSGPAVSWAQKLPGGLPRLEERLTFLSRPIQTFQKFLHQAEGLTREAEPSVATVVVQRSGLSDMVLSTTRAIVSGLFMTVLVLFFLLVSGETFLRRLVEILPRFQGQASGGANFAAGHSGHLGLPHHDHDHECCSERRNGHPRRGMRVGRSCALGNFCFPAELCAVPRSHDWCGDLRLCRAALYRDLVVGVRARRRIFMHPYRRGGDYNPDAARQALHDQSRIGHPGGCVLVLDVGRTRCHPGSADACHYQNHLRPHPTSRTIWPFHRGLAYFALKVDLGQSHSLNR